MSILLLLAGLAGSASADGACCLDTTATCTIEVGDVCERLGGYFYGDGTDCTEDFIECATSTDADAAPSACGAIGRPRKKAQRTAIR